MVNFPINAKMCMAYNKRERKMVNFIYFKFLKQRLFIYFCRFKIKFGTIVFILNNYFPNIKMN